MRPPVRRILVATVLALSVAAPATDASAAPTNDPRAAATPVTLPAAEAGTTVDSTLELGEAQPSCGEIAGSVWYAFTAPRAGSLVVRLAAAGDQDATVDVIRRVRSQLTPFTCERTNDDGAVASSTAVEAAGTYLVRVGVRKDSAPGAFSLKLALASPPPTFPGRPLPRGGALGTLDPLSDPQAAFTARLQAGVSYVISTGISAQGCSTLDVYAPTVKSFADDSLVTDCGWAFFTPDRPGRYPIRIGAGRGATATQRYHLRVRAVRPAEIAPGRVLPNFTTLRGTVSAVGGTPFALFRFEVRQRARLDLGLESNETVSAVVLTPGGRLLLRDDAEGSVTVRRGRYYVLVFSNGSRSTYRLTRSVRTITASRLRLSRRLGFGSIARVAVAISPQVSGPVELTVERFEPAFGWQFDRRLRTQARNGQASVQLRPFRNGLWRVSAQYLGTRSAAPSDTGTRQFLVTAPLAP